jgi:hypothetical protein
MLAVCCVIIVADSSQHALLVRPTGLATEIRTQFKRPISLTPWRAPKSRHLSCLAKPEIDRFMLTLDQLQTLQRAEPI